MNEKVEEETGTDTLLYLRQQLVKKGYNVEYTNEAILKTIQPVAKRLWCISTLADDVEECCAKNCRRFPDVFGLTVDECAPGICCVFPSCLQHALSKETLILKEYALLTRVPKHFLHRDLESLPSVEYARLKSLSAKFDKLTTLDNINKLCSK